MKKVVNGVIMDMTEEDFAAIPMEELILEPTAEERLEALEAAMLDVLEVLANG